MIHSFFSTNHAENIERIGYNFLEFFKEERYRHGDEREKPKFWHQKKSANQPNFNAL